MISPQKSKLHATSCKHPVVALWWRIIEGVMLIFLTYQYAAWLAASFFRPSVSKTVKWIRGPAASLRHSVVLGWSEWGFGWQQVLAAMPAARVGLGRKQGWRLGTVSGGWGQLLLRAWLEIRLETGHKFWGLGTVAAERRLASKTR